MAYVQPPTRRRRRRRVLVLLGAATIVAAVALAVVRIQSAQERLTDYLDAAREAAEAYDGVAVDIADLISRLEEFGRPELLAALEESAQTATATNEALAATEVPRGAGTAGAFLSVAAGSWTDGLETLRTTLTDMLDQDSDPRAVSLLSSAFLEFQVGDRAYGAFRAAVEELEENPAGRDFPDVRFIPVGDELLFAADAVAQRMDELKALEAHHDLAIASVRFEPEAVGDRDGVPVVPPSESIDVQVTVANRGNEPESGIVVEVRLIQSEAPEAEFQGSQLIEVLGPGEATTLTFPALVLEPRQLYELIARVEAAVDDDPVSNEFRLVFFQDEPS